jgi:hypothetical protein
MGLLQTMRWQAMRVITRSAIAKRISDVLCIFYYARVSIFPQGRRRSS